MENKMCKEFGRRNLRERNNLEDLRVKGRMDFTEFGWDGVDWIDLPQDWDKLWVAVYMVMNVRVL
jgi:hypothetical protein